ncbi:nuclear hormone receptor FTZ-F1 isoform X2 [Bactrocera oleae]|uniref:nuclear hormone receptor FTZ-F1 isoform X2 n=1 Tax=Bactrocera oleae TaxID=104688 RepID=UPI0017496B0C|nr:nuclear hormone receptor FTZ-F1 isoform X2 [Bactrocera oleae]
MDGYNVPMLSDSGYSSNNNNNIQTHTHHHKDQMLSAGSAPATPFLYEMPGSHKTISHQLTGNLKTTSDYAAFTNCIQQSALLDQRTVDASNIDAVSLSSLCDLKFPNSPTAESSFKNISLINIEANHVLVPAKSIATNDLINDGNGVEATFSNILYAKDDIVIETKDMPRSDAAQVTHVTHYLPLKLNNNNNNSAVEQKFPKATVTVTAVAATVPTAGTTTVAPAIAVSVPNSSAMTAMPYSTTVAGGAAGGGSRSRSTRGGRGTRGHANNRNGRTTTNRLHQQQPQQQQQLQSQPAEALGSPGVASASTDYLTTNAGNNFNVTVVNNQVNSNHHNHSTDNQITTTTTTSTNVDTANSKVITHGINNFISNNNHSQNSSASGSNGTGIGNVIGTAIGNPSNSSNSNNNSNSNNHNNNSCSNNVQNINSIATMSQNRATVLQSVEGVTLANSPTQRPGAVIVSTCVPEGSCNSNSSSVNINLNNTNNNNKTVGSSTMSPSSMELLKEPELQQSQLQQQEQQPLLHSSSVDCDSLSSMDDLLDDQEISEASFGYQDNTSSHSQQSVSGGGGGAGGGGGGGSSTSSNATNVVLLNGSNPNATGGYMTLLPPATSSGHMGMSSGGTGASAGGSGEGIDFKHLFEELCPVCGDKVSGYHYGLLTCESCKGFFKRTVQNKKVYTCVAERSCHIDKTQRKRCPYCRFQKCLEVGMKLEAVRADRMRGGRNKFGPMYKRDRARKLQVMRQRQLALQALRTSIGSVEMKSSPLSPGYQQQYPNMNIKQEIQIPQVSSLTQSPDSSPSPIAIALGQVNTSGGVISTPMNGGNGSSSGGGGGGAVGGGGSGNGGNTGTNNSNNTSSDGLNRSGSGNCHDTGTGSLQNASESKIFDSGTHPSSTADSIIEPLRVSPMIRDFVQSIDDREWQTQLFALLQKQTYNQVEVDLFELMCKVLDQNLFSQVDWARNTVFFKDLKVDDQMKLLQHSWSDMLVLDHLHQRIHNGLPDETQLNNGQVFNLLWLGLLGVPQLADYFNELQNRLQDLKFDMGDYVCMKFLILLNPDVRGIVNKKTVLEGQENVQAALLDYTLTCYPSVTDKFRRLLSILPDIHAMASRGEDHLYSKHCAGSAPTQTLLMEMLHAKRKV